jgi:hypothetical protein
MVRFTATIHKFENKGEKSGWNYIEIPAELADCLKPGHKKSFRVKGKLDHFAISGVSLLPMGDGSFILPINGAMRKGTGKKYGAQLEVRLQEDKVAYQLNADFLECLRDDPAAFEHFNAMPRSHQNYYSKWIESAKTDATKTKRIALAVNTLARKMNYSEMIRSTQKKNQPDQ